jgi:hypothetical protein
MFRLHTVSEFYVTAKEDRLFCICQILEEKMGVQWGSVSVIYQLQKAMTQLGEKYCTPFSLNLVYP